MPRPDRFVAPPWSEPWEGTKRLPEAMPGGSLRMHDSEYRPSAVQGYCSLGDGTASLVASQDRRRPAIITYAPNGWLIRLTRKLCGLNAGSSTVSVRMALCGGELALRLYQSSRRG
jgi:hypothetical protein